MQSVKGKGTRLEQSLWGILDEMGLHGWRANADDVPGKPDVVFDAQQVAVFIDGCFWHGCPYCRRKLPETNREYWERKIQRNVELARSHAATLREHGWTVIRIWEHDIKDVQKIETIISYALDQKGRLSEQGTG